MRRPDFQRLSAEQPTAPLLALYRRAILGLDDGLYSQPQKQLWLDWAEFPEIAARLLREGITLTAAINGQLTGFVQLHPLHTINMLYVDPDWSRRGIGTNLVRAAEQIARHCGARSLTTRASHASRPVFQRIGFEENEMERIKASPEVSIDRMVMLKPLSALRSGRKESCASIDDNGSADRLVITRGGHKQHLC